METPYSLYFSLLFPIYYSNSHTGKVQNFRFEGTLNWEQGTEKKKNNCTS